MHQDIEKLLNAAKEKGFITEKQREIILSKAKQLGEDMTEVEFMLEDIPLKKATNEKTKSKRCPNCGAIVDDLAVKCPECGFAFSDESEANSNARDIIKKVTEEINKVGESKQDIINELISIYGSCNQDDLDAEINRRIAEIIGSFSVPYTSNALIQGYEFVYGRYVASKHFSLESRHGLVTNAWLGKAKELYLLLQSVPNQDATIKAWLTAHQNILEQKSQNTDTIPLIILAVFFAIVFLVYLLD